MLGTTPDGEEVPLRVLGNGKLDITISDLSFLDRYMTQLLKINAYWADILGEKSDTDVNV